MAEIINMPRLSDTMEEGVVAKWNFKVGDTVKTGDILAEIETDKATMDFESFYDGVLLHIGVNEGETAPVDTLLAIVGKKGEDISELTSGNKTSEKDEKVQEAEKNKPSSSADTEPSQSNADSGEIPAGIEIIKMPRLSDTMTEGTVATWHFKEGDTVKSGDILAEIETDKATMDFESFYDGTLLKIGINEGESAPVDALLAIIGPKGTDVSKINLSAKPKEISQPEKTQKIEEAKPPQEEKNQTVPTVSTQDKKRIFASPLAKKMAEEKNIDLRLVNGSGENGRIIKKDIQNYQPAAASGQIYIPVGVESFEEIKNSQMRKTIAKRLAESKFTAPHYYLTVELDMDNTIASRTAINEASGTKISFNDMIVKACAMALRKHPRVNTQWTSDVTRIAKHIHIGVAVAVEDGLVVPVLKFADQMSLSQINTTVKEFAGKARDKKLKPEEMEGSTFTVSNLGMFGIKEFTSIINQPNSSILSVGAIVQKPVVKNGQIVVGNTMTITMANDHRTVDGATGAQFLQTLKQYIENPITMFV